jgi:flavin reductase (DIM6/NTAB) family NADH-FMN oxidoreductase RutF
LPRPIAFVSTVSEDGIPNLAPFSFFTVVSANPPVVCFCPLVRPAGAPHKDTLNNVRATGEFVVNIVSEDFAAAMNVTCGDYPPEVSEWEIAKLTPVASELVRPARVGESRVQMECRLVEVVTASERPLGGSLVMGEVVRFHVAEEVFSDFRIDVEKLRPIGRLAGASYVRTTDQFEVERPQLSPTDRRAAAGSATSGSA